MTTGTDWKNRLWADAIIALAAAGAVIWWWHDRPMPLDHLADVPAIVEKFEETVFGNELGKNASTHVALWRGKINIFPVIPLSDDLHADLRNYLQSIEYLTGLELAVVNTKSPANVALYFAPKNRYSQIADDFIQRKNYDSSWTSRTVCYAIGSHKKWRYWRGLIVVGSALPPPQIQSCLLEELYQLIGPTKNTGRLRYSISHSPDHLTELSLSDKLILRALYDDRLAPGMPRMEAMRVARQVIAELHTAVRAQGPDALIHPRHAARSAPPRAAPSR